MCPFGQARTVGICIFRGNIGPVLLSTVHGVVVVQPAQCHSLHQQSQRQGQQGRAAYSALCSFHDIRQARRHSRVQKSSYARPGLPRLHRPGGSDCSLACMRGHDVLRQTHGSSVHVSWRSRSYLLLPSISTMPKPNRMRPSVEKTLTLYHQNLRTPVCSSMETKSGAGMQMQQRRSLLRNGIRPRTKMTRRWR